MPQFLNKILSDESTRFIDMSNYEIQGQKRSGMDFERCLVDIKFDSAMCQENVLYAIENLQKHPNDVESEILLSHFSFNQIKNARRDTQLYPMILSKLFSPSKDFRIPRKGSSMIKRIKSIAKKTILINVHFNKHISETINPNILNETTKICQNIDEDERLQRIIMAVIEFDRITDHLALSNKRIVLPKVDLNNEEEREKRRHCIITEKIKRNFMICSFLRVECYWNSSVSVFRFNNEIWVLPRIYLLLIHNKLHDLLSSSIVSHFLDTNTNVNNFTNLFYLFINHLIDIYITDEMAFFDIAKSLEGLAMANAIKKTEKWDNDTYWNNMVMSLFGSVEKPLNVPKSYYEILSMFETLPIPAMSELSCLGKILGHPVMNLKDAMVRHYLRTSEVTNVEKEMIQNVIRQAKRGFIINHQQKTGYWPKHLIDNDAGKGLKLASLLGKHPESKTIRQEIENINLEQYDYVKFLPCKELKAPDNLFGYLKDRAISLSRSHVLKNYLQQQFNTLTSEKEYYEKMN